MEARSFTYGTCTFTPYSEFGSKIKANGAQQQPQPLTAARATVLTRRVAITESRSVVPAISRSPASQRAAYCSD